MSGILKYSNGWGHLTMSLAVMACGMYLFATGNQAVGMSLISIVTAAWFIPGAARQVATEVTSQVNDSLPTPTPKGPQI